MRDSATKTTLTGLFLLSILLLTLETLAQDFSGQLSAGALNRVVIHTSGGKLRIQDRMGQNQIESYFEGAPDDCQAKASMSGRDLNITIPCPANTTLQIGTAKEFEIHSEQGIVNLDASMIRLDADLKNGAFIFNGFIQHANIQATAVNSTIRLDSVPSVGTFNYRGGNGEVNIQVPRGSMINTSEMSSMGHSQNSFQDSPLSEYKMRVSTGLGNTQIQDY